MPSQRVSQPRTEPKNEKTNFATPLMRSRGHHALHKSSLMLRTLNNDHHLTTLNSHNDEIYPIRSTPRRTPRRMPNIEF
ncbi:unnamed protein product, partial [Mesorhabditis belari]|uniref:Uncharacterized protein n=1 Tax=Mesorhabditis belari TaxID=2138241 RepID=A0AAF3F0X3_9BILA